MIDWRTASRVVKFETIREGLRDGLSDSQIAKLRTTGATKNQIISFRHHLGLNRLNAETHELPPSRVPASVPGAPRRSSRPHDRNESTDPDTRKLVAVINNSGFTMKRIAKVAGVSARTLEAWRCGRWNARPFTAKCVRQAIQRIERHPRG